MLISKERLAKSWLAKQNNQLGNYALSIRYTIPIELPEEYALIPANKKFVWYNFESYFYMYDSEDSFVMSKVLIYACDLYKIVNED